ncbi:Uu.00g030110.m01.CDS01 [Anthostomella pinea]|uniref:Uu.00g030110.m01.CDS01 n=1 Tax=Anthostomella pinea TaxID=933095 RepID=A0AAI8V8A7_9PEZI|nr:Uu.00g030110.m01.CDS01 [Anthostomella pinea]
MPHQEGIELKELKPRLKPAAPLSPHTELAVRALVEARRNIAEVQSEMGHLGERQQEEAQQLLDVTAAAAAVEKGQDRTAESRKELVEALIRVRREMKTTKEQLRQLVWQHKECEEVLRSAFITVGFSAEFNSHRAGGTKVEALRSTGKGLKPSQTF